MQRINDLLKHLLDREIDFVLIGGFAGVVHGSAQVTRDLDICALLTPMDVEKFRAALGDLHPKHRMNPSFQPSFLDHPKETANLKNLYLETDLGVLDVISEVTGVGDFQRLKQNAIEVALFGHKCKVISIDDLIQAKEALGRKKDLLVAEELRAIRSKMRR